MPALIRDERSGREVFFTAAESTFNGVADEAADHTAVEGPNQRSSRAIECNQSADRTTVEGSGKGTEFRLVRPAKSIIYGDGSPLDNPTKAALLDVSAFMLRAQVAIPWQPGDALLLDNARVQHSRESFEPPRRILASLVGTLYARRPTASFDGTLSTTLRAPSVLHRQLDLHASQTST